MDNQDNKTNRLIHSSSPYLKQHANNPVDWHEWGEEAFKKAEKENKMLLISIGYSACHWCHVMAHESFEDKSTAEIMNELYVCIKVDREERPDVDQLYMDACQLISGNGGWPLNAFALPDKRPIHAMTYAPTPQWQQILKQIHHVWKEQKSEAIQYAEKLEAGIKKISLPPIISNQTTEKKLSDAILETFESQIDNIYGGMNRAPKFPMPNNQKLLLNHGQYTNQNSTQWALKTLTQMSLGGIFDPIGGGFARYSVDAKWLVPHFEKMLYDNAQLIEVYSMAFAFTQNDYFKTIAEKCIQYCLEEMKSENGLYYSALDADSEGIEGLYYTFTKAELDEELKADSELFSKYFQCIENGNWEEGRNILYAIDTVELAAVQLNVTEQALSTCITNGLSTLKTFRNLRIKPGLDDKQICAWNALLLTGFSKYALCAQDDNIREVSQSLYKNMLNHFYKEKQLNRIQNSQTTIPGFLEDYALFIESMIAYYQCSFDESALINAKELCDLCFDKFYDKEKGFFKFSNENNSIIDKFDISDDVINSGNSIMANNLHDLSYYFDEKTYQNTSEKMLQNVLESIESSSPWYSNWANLKLKKEHGVTQIIFSAEEIQRTKFIQKKQLHHPNILFGFSGISTQIPLLKDKQFNSINLMYECIDKTCKLPIAIEN